MMKDALVKQLIRVEIRRSAAKPPTNHGQSPPLTFLRIEDGSQRLVISQAKVRRGGSAEDKGILFLDAQAFRQHMIDGLGL
jgi:hypothetical protein